MIRLPPKRPKIRSGILRAPQRVFPRHERWVRSHSCAVKDCANGPIEFAHVRSAANSGVGLKSHSSSGIPLCTAHHSQQHSIGQPAFERLYKIDLFALAAEFTRRSPDRVMREALAELDTLGHV